MKPNFALSLSFDGINLLHRAAGGWREVGAVAITSDDLSGELAVLRKTAASLEPGGVRTKLIIPSSQIKYLTINTPGLSDSARRKEAEHALHDATPYEVADLVYDISLEGPDTHVAAVARETLSEAEAFATEHRFHPVSFVAIPEDAPYLGEPFFGPTAGAAELLDPSDSVESDGIAVVVVGAIRPEADLESSPQINPELEPAPTEVLPEPETLEEPEADEIIPVESDLAVEPEAISPAVETVQNPQPEVPEAAPAKAEVVASETSQTLKPQTAPDDAAAPILDAEEPQPSQAEDATQQQPELDLSPVADADADDPVVSEEETPTPAGPVEATQATPSEVPAPPPPATPGTASIPPAANAAALTAAAAGAFTTAVRKAPDDVQTPPLTPVPAPEAESETGPKLAATGFASRRSTSDGPAKPLGGAQRNAGTAPQPDSSSLTQAPPATDTATQAPPVKTGFFSRRKPRKGAAAPIPAAAVPATGSEAERMTVFGARTSDVRGKPRFLGLILTVILLVFLAGVAAWAAVFLDDGIAGLMKSDSPRATASAPENQIDPEIIRTPDGIGENSIISGGGVELAALDPVLSAEETAVITKQQAPRPDPVRPVITKAEAAARYAVTGIWPLAPETPLTGPTVDPAPAYLNSIDARTGAKDAIALPAATSFETDTLVAAFVSPPPFGQRAVLGAAGLIKPTVEGILAPGGYTLIAASPPLKPPAQVLGDVATTPETSEITEVLTAIARARPKNRPLGLAERSERAALGGVTRIELAAFRPSLRPRSLQDRARAAEAAKQEEARKTAEAEQARTAAAATAAALAVPEVAAAVAPAPALQNATRLAIARSARPDTRPRNFARIVKRAQRAAPKETRVAAASASVAPRTVTPKVPSRASVTRSATVKNAINLRKVNLIGVYGKPSSRRALVRLSNGRYQKVKVGDRIDGGRVSAISNSELRYSKSGRNVVLKMP